MDGDFEDCMTVVKEAISLSRENHNSLVIKAEPIDTNETGSDSLNDTPIDSPNDSLSFEDICPITRRFTIKLHRPSFRELILMCHGFDPKTYVEKRRLQLFCPFCDMESPNISHLSRHAERKHSVRKNLMCKLCGKRFYFNYELLGHHRMMHGNKGYQCKHCPRILKSQLGLQIHEATHTGEKKYQCKSCDKRFSSSYARTVHSRHHHDGERPYHCKYCTLTFHSYSNVTSHERTHTTELPFHCSYCPKKFSANANRKAHERRIHTGERPYHCDFCLRTYATKSDLNAHIWTHKPDCEAKYQCEQCHKGFYRLDAFRKHSGSCKPKNCGISI